MVWTTKRNESRNGRLSNGVQVEQRRKRNLKEPVVNQEHDARIEQLMLEDWKFFEKYEAHLLRNRLEAKGRDA